MWSREDIIWLAGLYEGEGCVSMRGKNVFTLAISMTDLDVVQRAHRVAGVGHVYPRGRQEPHHKDQYVWAVTAEQHVVALLVAMWPWLGERRQAKAREVLLHFRDRPRRILTSLKRQQVVDDWRRTGDAQWTLARRHGISRSRVQQLIAAAREAEH